MSIHLRKTKGFTLIELLVVISIVSLLSSVVLTSVQSARVKARDSERLQELRQIQTALELYRFDYGSYPLTTSYTWACFDCTTYIATAVTAPVAATNIAESLRPYLSSTPTDPKRTTSGSSGYLYSGNPNGYCLIAHLTPENLHNFPSRFISPARCGGYNSSGVCNVAGTSWGPSNTIFIGSGRSSTGAVNYEIQGC